MVKAITTLFMVCCTLCAGAAPVITGITNFGYTLNSSSQATLGLLFTADASQTNLSDFAFFYDQNLTVFALAGFVAPVLSGYTDPPVLGATIFSSSTPTLTADFATVGGRTFTQVLFNTGGLALAAGQQYAFWVSPAAVSAGTLSLAQGTTLLSNAAPGVANVYSEDVSLIPDRVNNSSSSRAVAVVANFAAPAPELDSVGATVPLAFVFWGLALVGRKRRL